MALACAAYMNQTENETLPELEQKMNLAKRQLFVLFDFATLSPHELRLNSSTFSWSGHISDVVADSKQLIDAKTRQFQDALRFRIERLVEDLESFAQQVVYHSHHPSPLHSSTPGLKLSFSTNLSHHSLPFLLLD